MYAGRSRRSRRSFWFYSFPLVFLGISIFLLLWAVLRENLPLSVDSRWPWRVQLLDVGSATTMTTVIAGLVLARAQFSSAVRPIPAHTGRVARVRGFSSRYVWVSRVLNSSSSPADFHSLEYCVVPQPQVARKLTLLDPRWGTREEAVQTLERVGLRNQVDFDLRFLVFTTKAMAAIESIIIRMTVTDQVGDSRQFQMNCLIGAVRHPRSSHID